MRESQGHTLPLKLFEIGDVAYKNRRQGKKYLVARMIGVGLMDEKASYEDVQSIVYNIIRNLGGKPSAKKSSRKFIINGRCAEILFNNTRIGVAGEVHPRILNHYSIKYPVVISELDLNTILTLTLNT